MDEQPRIITRRDMLRGAGVVGVVAAATPAHLLSTPPPAEPLAVTQAPATPAARAVLEAFENLTATEADVLEAIVDRLIPADALGPGAKEARVAHYIDRALGGALASSRQAYAAGLSAIDAYARTSRGRAFLELSPAEQDAVLASCESGSATGFAGSSTAFFTMVLGHTRQGMFGDPYYGGNANFAGWDLLGYPGVRTLVSAADQKALEANQLKPNHKSAYDYTSFTKATASHDAHGHPGDHITALDSEPKEMARGN